jgi:hypothetical protein
LLTGMLAVLHNLKDGPTRENPPRNLLDAHKDDKKSVRQFGKGMIL